MSTASLSQKFFYYLLDFLQVMISNMIHNLAINLLFMDVFHFFSFKITKVWIWIQIEKYQQCFSKFASLHTIYNCWLRLLLISNERESFQKKLLILYTICDLYIVSGTYMLNSGWNWAKLVDQVTLQEFNRKTP